VPLLAKLSLVAAAAALLIVAAASQGAPLRSGLYGLVLMGPIRPVCSADDSCDAPAQVTLVFTRGGAITRARSARDGRYRAPLAPGYYTVRTAERIGLGKGVSPRKVHVRIGHWDRLVFHIDTGIR
jgi:hypothetical protein